MVLMKQSASWAGAAIPFLLIEVGAEGAVLNSLESLISAVSVFARRDAGVADCMQQSGGLRSPYPSRPPKNLEEKGGW